MSDSSPSVASSDADDDSLEYRSVEPLAIVSVLLGLASPVAIFQPLLTVIPILGLLTAVIAVAKIRGDRARSGRGVAVAGLVLSTFFLAAPLARYASAQMMLRGQAAPVAQEFLNRLQQQHPEQAALLQMAPDYRPPIDDGLWSYYRNDNAARTQLQSFVQEPFVRMLLALGPDADVKLLKVNGIGAGNQMALADLHYTVTFTDEDGQRKTLVVGILLERHAQPMNAELNPWRIREFTTDFQDRPPV
jgi:hypothetical protein